MSAGYSPEVLARQIKQACEQAVARVLKGYEPGPEAEEMGVSIREAFLSGCMQTASFLTRADGATTSQRVEQGIALAGEGYGMALGNAHAVNAAAFPHCNNARRKAGLPYPRTCQECGFKGCPHKLA